MHKRSQQENKPLVTLQSNKSILYIDFVSLWRYRELLYFLVWRDILIRYKQTAIGATWAILQPVVTTLLFTIIFSRLANIPSDGKPYPVFAFAALLPWNYFSQALFRGGNSLVGNANLITKVYFPRLLIPLSAAMAPLVDLFFSCLVIMFLMLWYRVLPTLGLFLLPFFIFQSFIAAFAMALWLTALNVKYRDVGHVIPFMIQAWMYASPVAYSTNLIPSKWRLIYSLNPMVAVIDGFRWAILGNSPPDIIGTLLSTCAILALLVTGIIYFKAMERTFADVI